MLMGVSLVLLPKFLPVFQVMGVLAEKDQSPLKHCPIVFTVKFHFYFVNHPYCIHCTVVNPFFGVPNKKDPGQAPMLYTLGLVFLKRKIVAML